jgi:ABC-type sugar transport system substrate-binding protein
MIIRRVPIVAMLAACFAVSTVLTACSVTRETPATTADRSGTVVVDKILVDYPWTSLPVYAALTTSVQAYAEQVGVRVEFTNDNNDLATQVSNLTASLSSDVDAVVSFPTDAASISSLARSYMDAGKIWVTYAGDLPDQDASLQFSFEESGLMLGRDAGQWAVQHSGGRGKVLILEERTTQIGRERTQGIIDGLRSTAPDLTIVAQQPAVTPDEGLSVTASVLAQHPDVAIILTVAGDAAQGAYQALLSAGRPADEPSIYVGGLDGNLYLFQQMQSGSMVRALVTAKTQEIAQAVVDIPVALGRGEQPVTDVPVYLVTAASPDLGDHIRAFGG